MSERDPEMMARAEAAAKDWRSARTNAEWLYDFAAAEVRRALVEELERLRACLRVADVYQWPSRDFEIGFTRASSNARKAIDARLRELRGETEQGPGNPPSAGDTAQTAAKDAGSTPAPGTYNKGWLDGWDAGVRRAELQSEVAAGSRAPERVENAQADLPAPASSRHDKPGSPATDEASAPKETLRQPGGADLEAVGSERLTRGSPAPLFDEATLRAEIARVWGPAVAPAFSGADVLDRAAWIMRHMGSREATPDELQSDAAKLRAASAKPAPERRDGGCS